MAFDAGSLQYTIEVLNKNAERSLKDFDSQVKNTEKNLTNLDKSTSASLKSLQNFGKGITSIGKTLTASITLPVVAAGAGFIKLAADAEEIQSKFNVVFSQTADEANAWAESLGNSVGRATQDIQQFAASTGDILKPLGLAEEEALAFSQGITTLALDVASFNNAADADVIANFNSALVGNTESLKQYGVVINATTIGQEALSMGYSDNVAELDPAVKAQIIYNQLLAGTSDAQGDLERTQDSFTNSLKTTTAEFKELGSELGAILLPIANQVLDVVQQLIERFRGLTEEQQKTILIVAGIAAALGPLLIIIGSLIGAVAALGSALLFLSANPIVLIIAGIVALVAAIAALIVFREQVIDFFADKFPAAFAVAKFAVDAFIFVIKTVIDFFKQMGENIVLLFNLVKNNFGKIVPFLLLLSPPLLLLVAAFKLVKDNADVIIKFLTDAFKKFLDFWKGLWKTFVDANKEAFDKVKVAVNTVANFLAGAVTTIGNIILSLIKAIINPFSLLPEGFRQAGIEAINGFINGLKEKFTAAIATVSDFGQRIINTVKGKLGISSPSKVFREFGFNTTEGFIEGLEDGTADVLRSVNGFVTAVIGEGANAAKDAIDGITAILQDTDRPVEEIAKVYSDVTNDITEDLEELEATHKDKLGAINSELEDVTKSLEDLRTGFDEDVKDTQTTFIEDAAQVVIEATEKRAELAADLAALQEEGAEATGIADQVTTEDRQKFEEQEAALKAQIATQDALLQSSADLELNLDAEIAKQKEFANLNEIEQLQFRFEEERLARETAFLEEQTQLLERQTALTLAQETELTAFQEQKEELIAIEASFTEAFIENLSSRENATTATIDKLIAEYKRLEAAARDAQSAGANISAVGRGAGFAAGGFTGAGAANQIAGVVHKGEYVVPKPMLKALPGLGSALEAFRTRGAETTNNNNNRSFTFNVENHGDGAADAYGQMNRMAWMSRFGFAN